MISGKAHTSIIKVHIGHRTTKPHKQISSLSSLLFSIPFVPTGAPTALFSHSTVEVFMRVELRPK
jgi:hypothetical protein